MPAGVLAIQVLAAAGGGGSGDASAWAQGGGGGGAGEVIAWTGTTRKAVTPGDSVSLTVGAGGAGGGAYQSGSNGDATTIQIGSGSVASLNGGGGGGAVDQAGKDGGSGGGVGARYSQGGKAAGNSVKTAAGMGNGTQAYTFWGGNGGGGAGGAGARHPNNNSWTAAGGAGYTNADFGMTVGAGGGGSNSGNPATTSGYGTGAGARWGTTGVAGADGVVAFRYRVTAAPDAPQSLTTAPDNTSANVSFTAPADDGGSAITGYQYTVDGSTWQSLTTAGTGPITGTITGLTNGTAYSVQVRAVNAIGGGTASTASSVTPNVIPPNAPTGLAVTGGDTVLNLSFTAPTDDGGSAITGYQYTVDGSTWQSLSTSGSAPITGTVTGLTNGTSYPVQVRAVNGIGGGTESSVQNGTPMTTPGTPTSVSVAPANTGATVTFTAPASDGGSAITGYQYTVDGSTWQSLSTSGSAPITGTVTGLTNGTSYPVQIRTVNSVGNSGATSPVSVTPAQQPPSAPYDLYVYSADSSLNVSFYAPSTDGGSAVTGYQYTVDGSTWHTLPTTGSSSLTGTITGLTNGTSYPVQVRAINAIGNSAASDVENGTPMTTPAAPSITVTPGDTTATVTFTAPNDGGSSITRYEYTVDGSTWHTLTTSGSAPITGTITGLTNSTAYPVQIRAVNSVGNGALSSTVQITPAQAPGPPQNLAVTPGNTSLIVSFNAPASDGGNTVSGYQYTVDGTTWQSLSTSGSAPITGTITGLTNGTGYPVQVRAVNQIGTGSAATAVTGTPANTPAAPTAVSATAGNGTATVVFTPPTDNGGSPITDYQISTNGGTTWTTVTTSPGVGSARTTTVNGLVNGQSYSVKVRAVNVVGAGAASSSTAVTPAPVPPGAPTAVTATAANHALDVTFTPPTDNGGGAITGYQSSTDGTTWTTVTTTARTGNSRAFALPGLTNGQSYTVLVRAVNAAGPGAASSGSTATPNPVPPDAPTGLQAASRNASADITFTPGDDRGSTITSYQYTVDGGTTWTTITTTGNADGTRTGLVTGLTNGTAATIAVRAVNVAGPSTGSTSATVTPLAPPASPATVTATAGTSSITVAWTAPTTTGRATITGYTATAHPGPATCTTTGAATCVLGAEAGTTYTITVVANSASGTSDPSDPSNAVTATAPVAPDTPPATNLTLTTDKGHITTATPGQQIIVIGTGFAPYSTATITVYSTPTALGTALTDGNGNFSKAVTVPAGLATGSHTLLAQGAAPDGTPRNMKLAISLGSSSAPTSALPVTGAPTGQLALTGLITTMTGAALYLTGRNRHRHPTTRS